MIRPAQLREQWEADLARIEAGYADALESDAADSLALAQQEGMIAAYRRIISDAKR